MNKVVFSSIDVKAYQKVNPKKAKTIDRAVKRGLKEYESTFKKLAAVWNGLDKLARFRILVF